MNKRTWPLVIAFFSLFIARVSEAHVGYVVPEDAQNTSLGRDASFLLDPLLSSTFMWIALAVLVAIALIAIAFKKIPALRHEVVRIKYKTQEYHEFIPWITRLSLGIALIGAGANHAFISPVISSGTQATVFIEILLGFLLLAGFLLTPVVLATLLLYVFAFQYDLYLIGNLDFFALTLSLFILSSGRPGVDDLVGIPFYTPLRKLKKYVPFILRIGVGGAMIFLAIYEKFLNPHFSAEVITSYELTNIVPVSVGMWVLGAGIIEFLVGLLLLVGYKTRATAVVAFLVLTLSFFFFKEDVYSHITLFGTLSALVITGGGRISIDHIHESRQKSKT